MYYSNVYYIKDSYKYMHIVLANANLSDLEQFCVLHNYNSNNNISIEVLY